MTNIILKCCKEQSNEPIGRYRHYSTANRIYVSEHQQVFNTKQRQQHHHERHHQHDQQQQQQQQQERRHQQKHEEHRKKSFINDSNDIEQYSLVNSSDVRSPSPNCHCSCHKNQSKSKFSKTQLSTPKSVSWSVSPSPSFHRKIKNSHSRSTKNSSTNIRVIGRYARNSNSPFTPTFFSSQESTSFLSNSPSPASLYSTSSTSSSAESSSNNYCDIHDLIEKENSSKHKKSSNHHKYYTFSDSLNNCRSLFIIRFGGDRFPTMDLMQLDSRLIIFSLADNYTRLSPDRIFQDFINTQSEGSKNITVFNISEPLQNWRDNVLSVPIVEFGWPERHAPSLEKLCSICKAIDSWLSLDDDRNVAVLYSKRDLSRSSLVVATFLHYIHISQSDQDVTFDIETMWSYYDQHLKNYLQPSQKRYIQYFCSLLSGERRINNRQLSLNELCIRKIPNFDGNALCRPFVQIFQNLKLIHTSPVLNIDSEYANNHDLFVFTFNPSLILRGEVLIKCYHLTTTTTPSTASDKNLTNNSTNRNNMNQITKSESNSTSPSRTEMFSLQFHTGTITDDLLIFSKDDIDVAAYDKRFRPGTTVELYFNAAKLAHTLPSVSQINDQNTETVINRNSYEFYLPDMEYTKGPLDGSLYATVLKKSHSPATILSECDEKKLDELLAEIFHEIETFPDASNGYKALPNMENDKFNQTGKKEEEKDYENDKSSDINLALSLQVDNISITDEGDDDDDEDSNMTWLEKQKIKKQKKIKNPNEMNVIKELQGTLNKHDINGNQYESNDILQSKPVIQASSPKITANKPELPPKPNIKTSPKISSIISQSDVPPIPPRISSKNAMKLYEKEILNVPEIVVDDSLKSSNGYKSSSPYDWQNYNQLSPAISAEDICDNSRTQTPSFPVKKASLFATDFQLPNGQIPMFIHDTSSFWYKPKISREHAVKLLMDKPSGTFLIRDSNSFRNAYGLAVKVSPGKNETTLSETVRHFLIESTSKGVQIKGCVEEPVFSSLAALVNQHSVTKISLPTVLLIPKEDIEQDDSNSSLARLYDNGARCYVVYFGSLDVQTLTGPLALNKVIDYLFVEKSGQIPTAIINFKASKHGIILTDNSHRLFFRKHYPIESIIYCELDSENRSVIYDYDGNQIESAFFGFVSRKKTSPNENECLIFGQFEDEQPPIAIVDFINKLRKL